VVDGRGTPRTATTSGWLHLPYGPTRPRRPRTPHQSTQDLSHRLNKQARPGHFTTSNVSPKPRRARSGRSTNRLRKDLLDAGRTIAAERRVDLEWVEADAEALPFTDNSFDVVMSCVGAMFAPRHQRVADELVRVCRPGGTIGMINWTPEGFIGKLFKTMSPYAPPPPAGASPPPRWGDEQHVRELFGNRVTALDLRRQSVIMDHCTNPTEFREYWKRNYGPTIAVYNFNAVEPGRVADLDRDFLEFLTTWNRARTYEAEYLLLTARKR
jgi:SAM-dependent methyltransferase